MFARLLGNRFVIDLKFPMRRFIPGPLSCEDAQKSAMNTDISRAVSTKVSLMT